jgi:hypothetical protein
MTTETRDAASEDDRADDPVYAWTVRRYPARDALQRIDFWHRLGQQWSAEQALRPMVPPSCQAERLAVIDTRHASNGDLSGSCMLVESRDASEWLHAAALLRWSPRVVRAAPADGGYGDADRRVRVVGPPGDAPSAVYAIEVGVRCAPPAWFRRSRRRHDPMLYGTLATLYEAGLICAGRVTTDEPAPTRTFRGTIAHAALAVLLAADERRAPGSRACARLREVVRDEEQPEALRDLCVGLLARVVEETGPR